MSTSHSNTWPAGIVKPGLSIHRSVGAIRLDILAAVELAHGHHRAAEHLANLAAEMRETRAGAEASR